MGFDARNLPEAVSGFLDERHLATLTTLRPDGTPHVVPVGFTWDGDALLARVITSGDSSKARNARLPVARAALCQVAGIRWVTLEGPIRLLSDEASVTDAVERYARRYRQPRENAARVVLEISVERVMGTVPDAG